MPDAKDTASISFTGLYTGEVFYRNGLSPFFLATSSEGAFYHLMHPMESVGRWLGWNQSAPDAGAAPSADG